MAHAYVDGQLCRLSTSLLYLHEMPLPVRCCYTGKRHHHNPKNNNNNNNSTSPPHQQRPRFYVITERHHNSCIIDGVVMPEINDTVGDTGDDEGVPLPGEVFIDSIEPAKDRYCCTFFLR